MPRGTPAEIAVEITDGPHLVALVEGYAGLAPVAVVVGDDGRLRSLWRVHDLPAVLERAVGDWPPLASVLRATVPELWS